MRTGVNKWKKRAAFSRKFYSWMITTTVLLILKPNVTSLLVVPEAQMKHLRRDSEGRHRSPFVVYTGTLIKRGIPVYKLWKTRDTGVVLFVKRLSLFIMTFMLTRHTHSILLQLIRDRPWVTNGTWWPFTPNVHRNSLSHLSWRFIYFFFLQRSCSLTIIFFLDRIRKYKWWMNKQTWFYGDFVQLS